MAPEQARGLPLTLDARTTEDRAVLVAIDVWGLGALAYGLLMGRSPWLSRREDDLSVWEVAASTERPAPLVRNRDGTRIPRRLRRVIEKAMATDPKVRYASAAAVANELQAFLSQRPTTLDRSRLLRVGLWCRRNPQLAMFVIVAIGLTALAAGTRATVERLREERAELARELEVQKAEETVLKANVKNARVDLAETHYKLATEQQSLADLEKSIAEERGSYQTLIDAKEQALRDATASTRQLMGQLEASRRERRVLEETRVSLEKKMEELRREGEKAAKDRDRNRREREAARAERDTVQRERDAAVAEREAIEKQLAELRAELDRSARARSPRN
jgi:cell division protein FtsB